MKNRLSGHIKRVVAALIVLALLIVGGVMAAIAANSSNDAFYTTEGGTWVQVDESTWTMDKDGNGKPDITLVKKGDRWEYLFQVQDDKAAYYGFESNIPDGYTIDGKGDRTNPVHSSDAAGLTITNNSGEQPEYGALRIRENTTGSAADPEQYFRMNITLTCDATSKNTNKFSGTMTFGNVTFTDGVGMVYLKNGESAEMTDIPAGTQFKIEQTAVDGYAGTVTGGTAVADNAYAVTGTIEKDQTQEIVYTNQKDAPVVPPVKKGSFKVKKQIEHGNAADSFRFSGTLLGLEAGTDYTVEITRANQTKEQKTLTANAAGSGYLEFDLKAEEVAEFKDFPVGCNYQIEEEATDYTASYEITDERNPDNLLAAMSKKENYEKNQTLSTQRETLDENEQAVVAFTNKKPAPKADTVDISVTKKWSDQDNATQIRPDSVTVQIYQSEDDKEQGDMVATAQLDEASNWTTTFKELDKYPPNSKKPYVYKVEEVPVAGYVSAVTDDGHGNFTVTNTLSGEKTGDLKVSKTVEGKGADQNKEFRFTMHLEKDGKPVTGTYSLDSGTGKGTKTGTVYFDGEDGATLTLKHGESAYITGIAAGTTYTVEETAYEDWVPSLEDGTALTGTITADALAEVKVKNTYEPVADLTVGKTVRGSMGNKNQEFDFTLTLTAEAGETVPDTLTCEKEGKEVTLTKDAESGTFHFTLSHKETIRIKDIRKGTTYAISESGADEKGYTVTCDAPTGILEKDTQVHFTNERKGSVPTLADMNTVIPTALVLLAVVGMAGVFVKNRKKKKEQ